MTGPDCEQQLQAGAYLLRALHPEEAERYREHVQDCASCRRELDELQPAISALRTGTPVRADDVLRGRSDRAPAGRGAGWNTWTNGAVQSNRPGRTARR